jgi:hypothetical protein
MTIIGFKSMGDEGANYKTKEFWTKIKGKRIYACSLEALCRTVAFGWSQKRASDAENDMKIVCLYCGAEGFSTSEPCSCFLTRGDRHKRVNAMQKLNEIMRGQKVEEKPKSSILLP